LVDSSWNIGSIGIAGPPLRGPSSSRLLAEPPLSPPVSTTPHPTASAQPLEPVGPLAPPAPAPENASSVESPSVESPAPTARPATSLESLLMRFRLITPDQLDEALHEQRSTGRDVGAIVVERGWINEDQLARLLSYAPAFPAEPAAPSVEPDAEPAHTPAPEAEAVPAAAEEPLSHEIPADPEKQAEPELEPEREAEPQTSPPGSVISAGAAQPAHVSPVHPLLSSSFDVQPALELVEPEATVQAEPAVEVEPEAKSGDAPAPFTAPEAKAEPALEAPRVELAPLAPVVPAAEPVVPALDYVQESAAPQAEAVPDPQPQPEVTPVAKAPALAPAPVTEAPAPEPVAAPEPPAAAPAPQTVKFVEPAAIETIARVFVRLSNGERVEAGSFDDVSAAKARAEEVVREVANGGESWPFFGGRYIRPDVVVSVDVDATVVRYA
jgi:hypothetical protein